MNNLDQRARDDFKKSKKSIIYWIIISSFCYYHRYESILSDEVFDKMCKLALKEGIKHSLLSHLITDEDLAAGSLYALKRSDYPDFIHWQSDIILREIGK